MATATTNPKKQRKLRGGIGGDPIAAPVVAPPAQPTRSQGKQASIDDLVYEHGNNFLEHADADDWLAAVGLQRGDVTPATLKTADKRARERLDSVLNWDPPLVDTWENGQATHHIWNDRSKRYRIARTDNPAQPGFMAAVKVEEKGASEQLIGGDYKSLRAALEAVEAYHLKITKRETVDSNAPETIKAAEESGLASRPRIDAGSPIATISPGTETTQTEENEMATTTKNDALYVPEKDARKLLVAMGKAEASTPTKRLTLKLNKIPELMADANEVTGENLALLKRVGAAVQEGVEIVVGDKPAAKPGKVKGKAGAKPSANGHRGKSKYPPIFEFSLTRTLHWMGKDGFNADEALKALAKKGLKLEKPQVTTGLGDGKNPKYSKPAEFTKDQQKELREAAGKGKAK